jgi:hypothetical protein
MRNAETILNIIQERGKRELPVERIYRLLYEPDLYLKAYGKIYRNDGAMTPGITGETVDYCLPTMSSKHPIWTLRRKGTSM